MQFGQLLAERQSNAHEILRWKGRQVTVDYMNTGLAVLTMGPVQSMDAFTVLDCSRFYVTLQKPPLQQVCIPLTRVSISFDAGCDRLKLEVSPV